MTEQTIFETRNLSKNYGRIKAIEDLSFRVRQGEIFGILGPNGSGKTTTLSIAMGVLTQDMGEYSWFNQAPSHHLRKEIGSMIEVPNFFPYLSLIKNLEIIAKIKGYGEDDIDRVLTRVNLFHRRKSKFRTLSLGMKQRLGIASSLLGDPKVLVLDEPTNGLDPEGIAEVRELITNEARQGKTILMASHILSEVEKVCSHVAILKNGKLLEQGDVRTLLGAETLLAINAKETTKLEEAIGKCKFITWSKKEEQQWMVGLEEGKTPGDLNSFMFSNGIVLTSLVSHKKTLESQFLELVKE